MNISHITQKLSRKSLHFYVRNYQLFTENIFEVRLKFFWMAIIKILWSIVSYIYIYKQQAFHFSIINKLFI
jgi:hypothetical protein